MLTLRQLYYQFVARAIIENKDTEYKRLGSIINDARLAGLLDWDYLEDRTRNLEENGHWGNPEEMVSQDARVFQLDKWENQPNYVEVWVEKEALSSIVERIARRMDIPYFSCRGYVSQSEMHSAGMRLCRQEDYGKDVTILHLGDHDPSGIGMSRDIQDRLNLFGSSVDVKRIALSMDQINQYNPPPNPVKLKDSRADGYKEKFGNESWELDALDPATLSALIEEHVLLLRDEDLWDEAVSDEENHKAHLSLVAANWEGVTEYVTGLE